ncbi:MAG: transposase [Deltaproteobacteria bacterium]|nr:transposase [Deltaproteobacteria bacterium]
MPRQARLDAPGVLQHVIARGIEKTRIFCDELDYRFFIKRLENFLGENHLDCFAWALIPNHFHLLLRTGPTPLATFMRRLMTSYAGYFNRRYNRSGHLFQNRYKSLLCEEDPYFLELVRYIHLNPLRSGLVNDLEELKRYPWCGFGVLMGRYKNSWQEVDEILKYFGNHAGQARARYKIFMEDGIKQGRRSDLTGGGLTNRNKDTESLPQTQERSFEDLHDSRILGSPDFVKRVFASFQWPEEKHGLRMTLKDLVERVATWSNLSITDITSGSKRAEIARIRAVLSYLAIRLKRMKAIEVADFLNVSPSAISKCVLSGEKVVKENLGIMEQLLK